MPDWASGEGKGGRWSGLGWGAWREDGSDGERDSLVDGDLTVEAGWFHSDMR